MPLLDRVADELKESLKAGNHAKVSVIRLLKSSIKNKEIEKRRPVEEDEIVDLIMSAIKQRRESIEQFTKGGREDLAKKEAHEIEILQSFLPPPLTREDLESEIKSVIEEVDATSPEDIGKVMKVIMVRVKGRAEGAKVRSMVKEIIEAQVH